MPHDTSLEYLTQKRSRQRTAESPSTKSIHPQAIEDVKRTFLEMIQAYNAQLWDLYASFLAPHFVFDAGGRPLSKQESLNRAQYVSDTRPNYLTEPLGQMVVTPDLSERSAGRVVLSVLANTRQVGDVSRGIVSRDVFQIMRFVQTDGKWLCESTEGAFGCNYFDIGVE